MIGFDTLLFDKNEVVFRGPSWRRSNGLATARLILFATAVSELQTRCLRKDVKCHMIAPGMTRFTNRAANRMKAQKEKPRIRDMLLGVVHLVMCWSDAARGGDAAVGAAEEIAPTH